MGQRKTTVEQTELLQSNSNELKRALTIAPHTANQLLANPPSTPTKKKKEKEIPSVDVFNNQLKMRATDRSQRKTKLRVEIEKQQAIKEEIMEKMRLKVMEQMGKAQIDGEVKSKVEAIMKE
mmetsp:Transcript_589/g.669  ORF Transcript_589/g.669 Transcript_589/m.669 type:complete len:122 (+) Transcript_589:1283-1648(+)